MRLQCIDDDEDEDHATVPCTKPENNDDVSS